MRKMILVGFAIATSAAVNIAQAQGFKPGIYAGVEAGYAPVKNNAQAFANSLVATNGGSASTTQNLNVGIGRIFAGYKITENFDAEVGYFTAGNVNYTFSGVSSGSTAYSGVAQVATNGWDYAVLVRPGVSTGLNNVFLTLGGHTSKEEITVTGTNIRGGKSNANGNGYLYGLGYDLSVAQSMDVRFKITRVQKIAGTDDAATAFTIGIVGKF
jgi:hypothetical protein